MKASRVYDKPQVSYLATDMVRWPRSARVSAIRPSVAFADFLSQKTTISKTIQVYAPVDRVWKLVGDPMNIPSYSAGVVKIEMIGPQTYTVTDTVPPTAGDTWKTITFEERIVDSKPDTFIKFLLTRGPIKEFYTFEMQPAANGTILTLRFEADFRIENHSEVEQEMERSLIEIARLVIDKNDLAQRVRDFQSRHL